MSRIIAGSRRGHRLATPTHDATRPTSDKVREAAFSVIGDWAGTIGEAPETMLDRFSFLDLYAGSGAVGLEAASRGAGPVVCVEKDAATASVAARNARQLDLGAVVATASAESFLDRTPQVFDIVWLDPPYPVANARVEAVLGKLTKGWLASDGLMVVERSSRGEPFVWPDALPTRWERRYGETTLFFATKEPA